MSDWENLNKKLIDELSEKAEEAKIEQRGPKTEEERAALDARKLVKEVRQAQEIIEKIAPLPKPTVNTKLKKGDPRMGLRFTSNCLTCKYFWYVGNSQRGWCHYPSHYPRLSRAVLASKDIDQLLKNRNWHRTHPMLVCDLWTKVNNKKKGKALDWTNYKFIPAPEFNEDDEYV